MPYSKDYGTLGSILESPYLGKLPNATQQGSIDRERSLEPTVLGQVRHSFLSVGVSASILNPKIQSPRSLAVGFGLYLSGFGCCSR